MTDTVNDSDRVPEQVKRLCRMVAYGFYGKETGLIVDQLCRVSIMREDDLCESLRMDRKILRTFLASLKNEHIIKTKMSMEATADETKTKSTFYFIEYPSLLNLVKYKLELMRRKLETQVKTEANRSSFICPGCKKTFSDLEAGQLMDMSTFKLICTICGEEVEEQAVTAEQSTVRMAFFNEQLNPFFDLVREIDALDLSLKELQTSQDILPGPRIPGAGGPDTATWSQNKPGVDYNYIPQAIVINIGDDAAANEKKKKELPAWMAESTVIVNPKETVVVDTSSEQPMEVVANDQVLAALMRHETKVFEEDHGDNKKEASDDEFEDVEMDGDGAEQDGVPRVKVGNDYYDLDQITDDIVERMTEEEKQNYIRIGQEAYADLYS